MIRATRYARVNAVTQLAPFPSIIVGSPESLSAVAHSPAKTLKHLKWSYMRFRLADFGLFWDRPLTMEKTDCGSFSFESSIRCESEQEGYFRVEAMVSEAYSGAGETMQCMRR